MRARVHDGDAIRLLGDDAEIVRDEQQREAEARLQIAQQIEDLPLDRDVERGRRLVGDEQPGLAGEGRGDQRALAEAAGQLVRVFVDAPLRIRHADGIEQLDGPGPRRPAASQPMHFQRFGDLAADGVDGVECRHRLLQHQADFAAADRAHRALVEGQEVAPVEPHRAPDDPPGRVDQAQDRQRGQRLATARLAHQGQRLAGVEREADARHGGHQAALDGEDRGEAVDVEEGHRRVGGRGCRVRVRLSVVESPGSSRQPTRLREHFLAIRTDLKNRCKIR